MKVLLTDAHQLDPNEYAQEVLSSKAFAGARLFFFEKSTGEGQELLMFALKCPVSFERLRDMVHVLVDSVDFYQCWAGGHPPTETDLASLSPME